jgi:putative endonuclease
MGFPRLKTGLSTRTTTTRTTKAMGDAAEERALDHLTGSGLRLVARNYRTPGRGGGEIDLIMREPGGTLVFVEVRQRASRSHGGAAASVSFIKQRRIVFAARHFLMRLPSEPPCRFDVVSVEDDQVQWLRGAFDAG